MAAVELDDAEQAMLAGEQGPACALAMRRPARALMESCVSREATEAA